MSTEKMREEFEAVLREDCEASGIDAPDLRISPCILDDRAVIYINDITQACWWAYRKGWKAFRAAIEAELRDAYMKGWEASGEGWNAEYPGDAHLKDHWIREREESLGLKVKP